MGTNVSGLGDVNHTAFSFWESNLGRRYRKWVLHSAGNAQWVDVLLDMSCAALSWTAVLATHAVTTADWSSFSRSHFLAMTIYLAILAQSCSIRNVYRNALSPSIWDEIAPLLREHLVAALLLACVVYLSGAMWISTLMILAGAATNLAMCAEWRNLRRTFLAKRVAQGHATYHALIVGAGVVGRAMAEYFTMNPYCGYLCKGFLDSEVGSPGILGTPQDLARIARSHFVNIVFITSPTDRDIAKAVTLEAQKLKIGVKIVPDLYDGLAWTSPIEHLGDFPVQVVHRPPIPYVALLVKRGIDVAVSALGLAALAPLMLLIAVAIKLESSGPILYCSSRVGKKGRRFTCYKFRSMVADADLLTERLRHLNERDKVLFKIRHDPRVTRLGKVLRKYSLDEFPQLWNVLRGEMSLVGPRPPVPAEVEMYSVEQLRRLEVVPGLTGLWQIRARKDPSFDTYMALDLEYIETWNPLLDLKLLIQTIPAMLKGTGS